MSKLSLNSKSNNQTYTYKKMELCNSKTDVCKERMNARNLAIKHAFNADN